MQRLAELYENEKKYVEKLSLAKKYGDYIERSKTEPDLEQMPEDFVGKEQFVFNNLDRVLKFHQNYILPEIEKAQKNPEEILNIFKNRKEQFKIHYGKFCSSRNRYSKIIVDYREYLQVLESNWNFFLSLIVLRIFFIQKLKLSKNVFYTNNVVLNLYSSMKKILKDSDVF